MFNKLNLARALAQKTASKLSDAINSVDSLKHAARDLLLDTYIVVGPTGEVTEVTSMSQLTDAVNSKDSNVTILPKQENQ